MTFLVLTEQYCLLPLAAILAPKIHSATAQNSNIRSYAELVLSTFFNHQCSLEAFLLVYLCWHFFLPLSCLSLFATVLFSHS
jgi:hypothetical protein